MTLVGAAVALFAFLTSCGIDWARLAMATTAVIVAAVLILIVIGHFSEFGGSSLNHWPVLLVTLVLPAIGYAASWLMLLSPWVRAWVDDIQMRNQQLVRHDDRRE